MADDYTWLDYFPVLGRKNWPFLFNECQEPKPAFWKVIGQVEQNAIGSYPRKKESKDDDNNQESYYLG